MRLRTLLRTLPCLALLSVLATAQNAARLDDAAVRKVIAAYADAENKRDAKAMSALFTRDSPDREAAAKRAAAEPGFWTEKTRPMYRVNAVRALTADVAVLEVTGRWYQSNSFGGSSQWLFVLVKEKGEWKISTDRQVCVAPTGRYLLLGWNGVQV